MSDAGDLVRQLMSTRGQVRAILQVEAALADAHAETGAMPPRVALVIGGEARVEHLDLDAVDRAARDAGNLVIPVVEQLAARVGAIDPEAAGWVHAAVTSQDVLDTAMVTNLRAALQTTLGELRRAIRAGATLARRHAETVMAGRTLLQYAAPTTFGLKAAGWSDAISRSADRLDESLRAALVLQLGGASGTQAALGARAPRLERALARRLDLAVPALPWHTQRDRLVDLAATLATATGVLGKLGRDVALLAQTEVAELREAGEVGRGRSSAMPHKRNPVGAVALTAAATRAPGLAATMMSAMAQEHERAAGGWQAEWAVLPELVILATDAASTAADLLEGLEVDAERMAANLGLGLGILAAEGLAAALASRVGRPTAHRLVGEASRDTAGRGVTFREVVEARPDITRHFAAGDLERLLDPAWGVGRARALVDRALDNLGFGDQDPSPSTEDAP
ncbi:MAG: lyase family protein [Gemmatimonadales bacterium]